jgi:hypothetical protein
MNMILRIVGIQPNKISEITKSGFEILIMPTKIRKKDADTT